MRHPTSRNAAPGELRSVKDFRNWAGSVLTLARLRALSRDAAPTAAAVTQVVDEVALANTPTACRKPDRNEAALLPWSRGTPRANAGAWQ